MDKIFHHFSDKFPTTEAVGHLFSYLPANDPMLRLMVDAFCVNDGVESMADDYYAKIGDLPKDFLVRVLRKQHQLSQLPEEDKREDYSMVVCLPFKGDSLSDSGDIEVSPSEGGRLGCLQSFMKHDTHTEIVCLRNTSASDRSKFGIIVLWRRTAAFFGFHHPVMSSL